MIRSEPFCGPESWTHARKLVTVTAFAGLAAETAAAAVVGGDFVCGIVAGVAGGAVGTVVGGAAVEGGELVVAVVGGGGGGLVVAVVAGAPVVTVGDGGTVVVADVVSVVSV